MNNKIRSISQYSAWFSKIVSWNLVEDHISLGKACQYQITYTFVSALALLSLQCLSWFERSLCLYYIWNTSLLQDSPSRKYPAVQLHSYDPSVLMQPALASKSSCRIAHSSISENECENKADNINGRALILWWEMTMNDFVTCIYQSNFFSPFNDLRGWWKGFNYKLNWLFFSIPIAVVMH